ncbi:MAG: hypothetical protein SGILL_002548 [Bacillariaceae sp.]
MHPKLAVCTVDGNVFVLDAHDGEIASFFSSGIPLVGPSEPLTVDQDRRIVPGLDGRLYVSSQDGLLDSLEITVMDVLANPVKTCKSKVTVQSETTKEDPEDDAAPPIPFSTECGIVTATKSTSLFALDSTSGNLVWQQHPNGTTTSISTDRTSDHTVILQREDVLLQQISTLSGKTVWNVTLGTLQALDFGDGLAANGDLPPPTHGFLPSGDSKNLLLEEYLEELPHVLFNPDGTGLSAIDPESQIKLWTRTFPTVVASVFGLQGRTWEPLTVLDDSDDDDDNIDLDNPQRFLPDPSHELATYRSPFSSMNDMYRRLLFGMEKQQEERSPLFQSPVSIKRQIERGATSQDHRRSPSSLIGDYYQPPRLALPSPELLDSQNGRRESLYFYENGIYFSWQMLIVGVVFVLAAAIFVGRFVYKKKKKLWIKRATVSFDLNPIAMQRSTSEGSVDDTAAVLAPKSKNPKRLLRSHSLPGNMDGIVDQPLLLKNSPAFPAYSTSVSPPELMLSTPEAVPFGTPGKAAEKPATILRSLTEGTPSQGVGLIDGRFPLLQYSRYMSEFEELSALGSGGFGSVFRVRNNLDGRNYAVKKIRIRRNAKLSETEFSRRLNKILREVKALALLDHPNIVRYFNAWLELDNGEGDQTKLNAGSEYYLDDYMTTGQNKTTTNNSEASYSSRGYNRQSSWGRGGNGDSSSQLFGVPDALDDFGFVFDRSEEEDDAEPDDCNATDRMESTKPLSDKRLEKRNSSHSLHSRSSFGIGFQSQPSNDDVESSVEWSRESRNQSNAARAETSKTENMEPGTGNVIKYILYIQMQYCSQKTVADFLSNEEARKNHNDISSTPVDIPHALTLFLGIMQGVEHVHGQGLIHRDLKPNNCFLDDSGAVKVGDFGLSRNSSDNTADAAEDSLVEPSVFDNHEITAGVGTRSYASPEQMKGGAEYDSSTDIFSLGIILFELCYPMTTGMERNIVLSDLRKHVFPELWRNTVQVEFPVLHEMLMSMISNEPKDRPTAQTVVKTLHTILDGFTISSLDSHGHEGAILLRVETHPRDDVLQYTMDLVLKCAQPILVDIVQYGLRGVSTNGEMKSIMEFAVVPRQDEDTEHCLQTLGGLLVSKLTGDDSVIVARQVLGSKQRYRKQSI